MLHLLRWHGPVHRWGQVACTTLGALGILLGAPLWVPMVLIGCAMVGGAIPNPAPWKSEPEPIEYPDPVDACGHDDAAAEPVLADLTGDGEQEVVCWLCVECGGKVSPRAAARRNMPKTGGLSGEVPAHIAAMRTMLADVQRRVEDEAADWRYDEALGAFEITPAKYERYKNLIDAAQRMQDNLVEAEARVRAMREAEVHCKGYREVPGRMAGSVTRRYAVPGECLCGDCEVPGLAPVDVTVYRGSDPPKAEAIGDLWFDTSDGDRAYRATGIGAAYIGPGGWVPIESG